MSELELKIEEQFKFMQYSYSLFYAAVIDKLKPFMVDVAFKVTSLEQKAAHLRASQVIISASLLQQSLTKAIVTAGIPSVVITGDIDQKCQRQLDKMNTITELYDIIVQMTTLGMRSLDNKSNMLPIILVIVKSFKNRNAIIQSFNRVGRFGDKCSRETFEDVQIIVTVAEKNYLFSTSSSQHS